MQYRHNATHYLLTFPCTMPAIPKPRKQPSQQRSQQMVDNILEATARILVERGYAGTNTNIVAERAGVSVGSVYQYFPNKDALIAALHAQHGEEMHAMMRSVILSTHGLPLAERLARLIHAQLAAHLAQPTLLRILELELQHLDEPKMSPSHERVVMEGMLSLLREHQDEFKLPEPQLAAWVLLNTAKALIHAAVISPPAGQDIVQLEAAITQGLIGYLQAACITPQPTAA